MPKGLLQEKFQVTAERPKREDREWTSFESQRVTHAIPERSIDTSDAKKRNTLGGIDARIDTPMSNQMPPGMGMRNQNPVPGHRMPYSAAGESDVSDMVSRSMAKGYTRIPMRGTDDLYTNEHVEEFYGEATVDGKTGFLERNNYLDRN